MAVLPPASGHTLICLLSKSLTRIQGDVPGEHWEWALPTKMNKAAAMTNRCRRVFIPAVIALVVKDFKLELN
jgi:hypothetical protein